MVQTNTRSYPLYTKILRLYILASVLQRGYKARLYIRTTRYQRGYRRPGAGQPGGSFTGRRNALTFTSASTPALSGKTVERWVNPSLAPDSPSQNPELLL